MRSLFVLSIFLALMAVCRPALAVDLPPGYPTAYAKLVEEARREKRLEIYATTDAQSVKALLARFRSRYPFLDVRYHELTSAELFHRLRGEADRGQGQADVAWSSAMDLQVKLVNDGYAQPYPSVERAALPDWAQWRDEVYGTTFEPLVFAWDRRVLDDKQAPRTHAELRRQLAARQGSWKIATYDVESSGAGYLFLSQDAYHNPEFWDLARVLFDHAPYLEGTSRAMLQRLQSGEAQLAYNVLGAYAAETARWNERLGWRVPEDYALVVTRLTLISRAAPHPNAARLWTDFVLSREGQTVLAADARLPPIRNGLPRRLGQMVLDPASPALRPIKVGTGLLVYLDTAKKSLFLKRWRDIAGRDSRD
ncbi:ABC transporter substrate-binding protein [Pseudogulbenkiania sp. MAI-1]|uniref:ABC transporter substrate-binding protein n=1 Tax=Pseudogulbenkiania sp. MAI-1 TaxID=990370 RepID=UPI00045E831C|nr:ABC transporter substrate-binding protein [Pseudogulbenkiania sp. MAI-1]